MKTDRLYSSLVFSLSLHSLLVVAAVVYMMYSGAHYKAAVFDVSLVSPSENSPSAGMPRSVEAPKEEKSAQPAEKKPEMVTPQEKSAANERIAALEAKRKIENMQRLRKSIDISKSRPGTASGQGSTARVSSGDYESVLFSRVRKYWVLPERMDKDLVTVVRVRVSGNGGVTIETFDQKSGNSIYDKAALKAINDAANDPAPMPLPPPGYSEIYLRFKQ